MSERPLQLSLGLVFGRLQRRSEAWSGDHSPSRRLRRGFVPNTERCPPCRRPCMRCAWARISVTLMWRGRVSCAGCAATRLASADRSRELNE